GSSGGPASAAAAAKTPSTPIISTILPRLESGVHGQAVESVWARIHTSFHRPVNCGRSSRSLRLNHQQAPSGQYGNICSFTLQIRLKGNVENSTFPRWKPGPGAD